MEELIYQNFRSHLQLSHRQAQVATMLVTGLSQREIADQLGISIKGVKSHLTQIYKKLNLKSNIELVAGYCRFLMGHSITEAYDFTKQIQGDTHEHIQ